MPRAWVSDPRYDIRGIGNIRNSKARGECVFAAHSVPGPAVCGAEGRGRHGGRERRRQRVSLRCRNRAGLSAGERLDARSLSRIVLKRSSVRVRVTICAAAVIGRSQSAEGESIAWRARPPSTRPSASARHQRRSS